jgi:hypothetical protein
VEPVRHITAPAGEAIHMEGIVSGAPSRQHENHFTPQL